MKDEKISLRDEPEPAPQFIALTTEQLQALIANAGGRQQDEEFLKLQAKLMAEANKEVMGPRENATAPDISVYNPTGAPKADLKCKMLWCGIPLEKETLTPEEIAVLNRVDKSGRFQFRRTDGSYDEIEVRGERDLSGKLERLEFLFQHKGDKRNNLPSLVSMVQQVLGDVSELDLLRERIAELEAKALVG